MSLSIIIRRVIICKKMTDQSSIRFFSTFHCFRVIKDTGVQKVILFKKDKISVAEVITEIARNYDITDLNLKEPEIEEIVREIYDKTNEV